jgi:Protein of unknown function (DUF3892)
MARYRVTCTAKREKYERILGLGCYSPTNVFLTFTEAQVIDRIENQGDTFYVERPTGHVIDLEVVKGQDGTKYVKTIADGEKPDNLLSLPACPARQSTTAAAGTLGTVVAAASHGPADWR